jgi:cytochrome c553
MKNIILLIVTFFTLVGCQQSKETSKEESSTAKDSVGKKTFEMYEMSEMALLMEQMYVDNQRLKARLEKGEPAGEFPSHFAKIHSAIMTDSTENDDFFKKQAKVFLDAQQLIYKDPENAKTHYSNAIQACISCHEVKCSGPIVRIKKLLLN